MQPRAMERATCVAESMQNVRSGSLRRCMQEINCSFRSAAWRGYQEDGMHSVQEEESDTGNTPIVLLLQYTYNVFSVVVTIES
jgi:hypothetical protein